MSGKFHGTINPTTPRACGAIPLCAMSSSSITLRGKIEIREITEHCGKAKGFAGGVGQRLALLLGEQPRQFIGVGLNDLGDRLQRLARSASGVALQAGKAALAAATAFSNCALEARGATARTSSVAGLSTSICASPSSRRPLIKSLNVIGEPPAEFCACKFSPPVRDICMNNV